MTKLINTLSAALILLFIICLIQSARAEETIQAQQTQEYGTTLQVWRAIQELGSNLSGPAKSLTFRIKTDISYTQQFDFTASNTKIYDKDNNNSVISGCIPAGSSDLLRGISLNTGNAPSGYMDVSIDFSCRNYTFIPGHRYLLLISNANRGTNIHFATSTTLTSPTDNFTGGGVRYSYENPFEPLCNPIAYIWNSQTNNNGCVVFTSPKDDLYFILGDPPSTVPSPSPTIEPTPSPSATPVPTPPAKTPLIFIPGIAGSELKVAEDTIWNEEDGHGRKYNRAYAKDEVVWLNSDEAAKFGDDDYFDSLKLATDGQTSLAKIETTGNVISVYDPSINYFKNNGFTLGKDFFIFTYDWRNDLTLTSQKLQQLIEEIKEETASPKVDIITHSMGGLVARHYINNVTNASNVNKLVTVAPPFLGSVESTKKIHYGGCLTRPEFEILPVCLGVASSEVNDIYQNLISGFELAPTKKYYTFYDGSNITTPTPFRDERDIDNNLITGSLSYDQTKQLLTNLGHNTKLYSFAETFHQIDNNIQNINGVDMTIIAGTGEATIGQIIEKNKFDFFSIKIPTTDLVMINGDGTVPLFSASLNDPLRSISMFNPQKVFYVKGTHGGIINDIKVLAFAKSIFDENPVIPQEISTNPLTLSGGMYSVHSPVEIHAYDSNGNHTGPTSNGEFEEKIPGSKYEILNDAKFIFLPPSEIYQLKFNATDQGKFDFKIRNYENDKNTTTKVYKDIPLTKETTGQVFIDNNSNTSPTLLIDLNGDGTNDKQFNAIETSGSTTQDASAPTTKVTLEGTKGINNWYNSDVKVTLTAVDETNGSGISKVEYSVDNGQIVIPYSQAFTITKENITKLRVKATDKAGNEEQLQEIEIKIDKTAPEAKIIFNLTNQDFEFIGNDNLGKTTLKDLGDIITISDEAGNITKLTLASKDRPRRENIKLKSIQYTTQKAIKLDENLIGIFYTLNKKNEVTLLLQRAVVQGEERIYSLYNPLNNTTEILIKKPRSKTVTQKTNGKTLLYLETKKGELDTNF